jgi:hypothetical protein
LAKRTHGNFLRLLLYDHNNKKIIWEVNKNPLTFIVDDQLYGYPYTDSVELKYDLSKLEKYNLSTGASQWMYDVSENAKFYDIMKKKQRKGEVVRIIGCSSDTLWLGLTNQMIVSIDDRAGTLKRAFREIPSFKKPVLMESAIPNPGIMEFSSDARKIIGCYMMYYWEIDIETQSIDFFDLRNEMDLKGFTGSITKFVFDQDHVYALDHHRNEVITLDRKSKAIESIYRFNQDNRHGVFQEIQVKGDRLYLRDSRNQLFVLARK